MYSETFDEKVGFQSSIFGKRIEKNSKNNDLFWKIKGFWLEKATNDFENFRKLLDIPQNHCFDPRVTSFFQNIETINKNVRTEK